MRKNLLFFIILILYFSHGNSQNQLDSVKTVSNLIEFNLNIIDSLNIRKIKLTIYLSDNEKLKKALNKNIYSEITEYFYKKNNLVKDSRSYSGVDRNGEDHFTTNTNGFNTYSMIFENYYVYDKRDSLIRIDQNTFFKNNFQFFQDLNELSPDQFIIDKTPINKYLQIHFQTDADAILWQIAKNRYLYFKIVE